MMNFAQAEQYLLSLGNEVETMKLGLENIRKLLAALGNPETEYLKVQVAGTNGKGSVCAFLDSICLRAGIKTGVFTSPHLMSITERVRIEGSDISEEEFGRIASVVRNASERFVVDGELEKVPTYFEQVTAIALVAFAEAKVELAILETGLGGRYDAVTAANADVCAITRIDLDHQEYLGDTLAEIAAEKAAIIDDEFDDVVIGPQSETPLKIILDRCHEFGTIPVNVRYAPWTVRRNSKAKVRVETTRNVFQDITLGLLGNHQIENAETALNIVQSLHYDSGIDFDDDDIIEGLEKARHSGRLEYCGQYLLDGAHNVGGAKALRGYLDEFVDQPITMVFGAMKEKNVAEIAAILFPKADKIVLTQPSNSRAISADLLSKFVPPSIESKRVVQSHSVADAIKLANEIVPKDGIVLVTGSLYLVGEVRKILTREGE